MRTQSIKNTMAMVFAGVFAVSSPALSDGRADAEAEVIAGKFVSRLKPALVSALRQGGPEYAVNICAEQAPRIASELSASTGWDVKRVSLRARNPEAIPDAFEKRGLVSFDRTVATDGARPLMHYSGVDGDRYRYMKPQHVAGLCLACHGKNIAPAVQAAISKYYPEDQATGYEPGEVRGAISLSRPLFSQE